jgi:gliding motility-associated-like protein
MDLANTLAGPGVLVTGATINCGVDTAGNGYGIFSVTGPSILGFTGGVVLTSGHAKGLIGPNENGGESGNFNLAFPSPSDNIDLDLEAITGIDSHDACVLEMDLIPTNDTLFFEYQFGSEEYLTFVGTSFNDAFALYVSGPGIAGVQNLAIVPGTAGTPVSINNVNDVTNSAYYIDNGDGFSVAPFDSTAQYDGFTTILPAKVAVIPCNSYHLKLAISDMFDQGYDSGVFIKAGSLTSFGIDVAQTTQFGDSIFNSAVEGCNNGLITFTRTPITSFPAVINYSIGGTATPGVDFIPLSGTITIPAGVASQTITIVPNVDGIVEGNETLKLFLFTTCGASTFIYDSIAMIIQDGVIANVSNDTSICAGLDIPMLAGGGVSFSWSPATGLNDANISNPICSVPLGNNVYTVTVGLGPCTDTEIITIIGTNGVPATMRPDTVLCILGAVPLYATCVPQPAYTYLWQSPNAGDIADISSLYTTATPGVTSVYTLTITDTLTGCEFISTCKATIGGAPQGISISDDVTICQGESAPLVVSGGTFWDWSYDETLSCGLCPSPTATPNETVKYYVQIFNEDGCYKFDSVTVFVKPAIDLNVNPTTIDVYTGDVVQYNSTGIYNSISWLPSTYLSDTSISNPIATPLSTTQYIVTAFDADSTCMDQDTVNINYLSCRGYKLPSAFSPNGDNVNDVLYANSSGFEVFEGLKVFNRWGEAIFETTNIGNGWNGTYKGVQQEIGTYVYVIEGSCEGKSIQLKGNISLIR